MVNGDGAILIDLADLFQVTPEGKEGWVTVWFDASGSLTAGTFSNGVSFESGIINHNFDFAERAIADDRQSLVAGSALNLPGFAITLVEWSDDGGISGPRIEWNGDSPHLNLSLYGSASGLYSFEVSYASLKAAIENVQPGSSFLSWTAGIIDSIEAIEFRDITVDDGDWPLYDGVAEASLKLDQSWSDSDPIAHYFSIEVPPGQSALRLITREGSGDGDLYARFGNRPTISMFDFVSSQIGNQESIVIPNPESGTWHVMIPASSPYEGLDLVATLDTTVDIEPPIAQLSSWQLDVNERIIIALSCPL